MTKVTTLLVGGRDSDFVFLTVLLHYLSSRKGIVILYRNTVLG